MAFLQNIDAQRNIKLFYALQKPTMQKLVDLQEPLHKEYEHQLDYVSQREVVAKNHVVN